MGNNRQVLIDTSAWVASFRKNEETRKKIKRLIEEDRAAICGVVVYELLQGIRDNDEASVIEKALQGLHFYETSQEVWHSAGLSSCLLRRNGVTIPMSDVVIAAVARMYDLEVLTTDAHFKQIDNLKFY
ncbi:MAG: PIN domain-containing protein [Dissulfurispiraceae bacterium]